jgi:replicative DNA helicase
VAGRRINRDAWPTDGAYLRLLRLFDQVHFENGLRSLRDTAKLAHVSHSTVNHMLPGRRLPGDERQVASLILALGGSKEDVGKAVLLYPHARRFVRPPERQREKASISQSVAEDDVGSAKIENVYQDSFDAMDAIASSYPSLTFSAPTGFSDLDTATGGLRPGQLTVIAGPPSVGKSTLGLGFARLSARAGKASLFLTLETDKNQVVMNVLAAEARLRRIDMRVGTMSDDDWTRMTRRMVEISDSPLFIDDSAPTEASEFERHLRDARAVDNIVVMVLDYVDLISVGASGSQAQDVERLMIRLKLIARELKVAIVAITSIWQPEHSGVRLASTEPPTLSDLGPPSVFAHADVVLLLHRPDLNDYENPRAGEADIIIAKNRNGPVGVVTVAHQLHYARFMELARD